jgi:protein SCO1/2
MLLAVLASLAGCAHAGSVGTPPRANVGTRLDIPLPDWVLSIALIDSAGHTRHLSDFHGKLLVISDAMTLCQETCPIDTSSTVETAREVDHAGMGSDVEFLTITVDPGRDTPKRLSRYRSMFQPPQNWLALTGTAAEVHRLWKFFGVYWERVPAESPAPTDWMTGKPLTYDILHSDEVFFVDGSGHERFLLEGMPHLDNDSEIPARLYSFMNARGHRNVKHSPVTAWTVDQAVGVIGWLTHHDLAP